jgi:hypothetical protein
MLIINVAYFLLIEYTLIYLVNGFSLAGSGFPQTRAKNAETKIVDAKIRMCSLRAKLNIEIGSVSNATQLQWKL